MCRSARNVRAGNGNVQERVGIAIAKRHAATATLQIWNATNALQTSGSLRAATTHVLERSPSNNQVDILESSPQLISCGKVLGSIIIRDVGNVCKWSVSATFEIRNTGRLLSEVTLEPLCLPIHFKVRSDRKLGGEHVCTVVRCPGSPTWSITFPCFQESPRLCSQEVRSARNLRAADC